MIVWEYQSVSEGATGFGVEKLMLQLNALGSLGWEICGITAADPTLGTNMYTVVLKRQGRNLAPPLETAAGWKPDPSGRFAQRHWDGGRWTEHVNGPAGQDTDWPNVR